MHDRSDDPAASFYFGAFGNNRVDNGNVKRYRAPGSMPGFAGPLLADVLCYLRVYTELSLRAKGLLMMRENGFEAALDDETKARLAELRYLEGSIGKTGLLAVRPLLRMNPKDLWQIYMLETA